MRINPINLDRAAKVGLAALIGLSALVAGSSIVRAQETSPSGTAALMEAIRAMDEALAKGDVRTAFRAREDARLAALAGAGWEGLVLLGDATVRLGQSSGLSGAMEPAARRAYVFALYRARRHGSLEGVVRATEAFVSLGDRDMARKACAIAGSLAASAPEPEARERVRALENRLAGATHWRAPTASAAPLSDGSRSRDWPGSDDK